MSARALCRTSNFALICFCLTKKVLTIAAPTFHLTVTLQHNVNNGVSGEIMAGSKSYGYGLLWRECSNRIKTNTHNQGEEFKLDSLVGYLSQLCERTSGSGRANVDKPVNIDTQRQCSSRTHLRAQDIQMAVFALISTGALKCTATSICRRGGIL